MHVHVYNITVSEHVSKCAQIQKYEINLQANIVLRLATEIAKLLKFCSNSIPANQSDFVVFVPIFSSKKGEKSEQYDFYVGRRRKNISGAGAEYYRYSFPIVKANTRHLF